jgi:hypothetical protein
MRAFWSDPYLWVHLAGLATVPLWLELCFLGLAVGDPLLPVWLELALVALVGIGPILWMQWQRPFSIFSLVLLAIKPDQLTDDQRRLLTLFKRPQNRIGTVLVVIALAVILQKLYWLSPIGAEITPLAGQSRLVGLGVAAIAFLGANLFFQVPVSVLSVLFTGEAAFAATAPYPVEQIPPGFTRIGFPVSKILPTLIADPSKPRSVSAPLAPEPKPQPEPELDLEQTLPAESAESTKPTEPDPTASMQPEPQQPPVAEMTAPDTSIANLDDPAEIWEDSLDSPQDDPTPD